LLFAVGDRRATEWLRLGSGRNGNKSKQKQKNDANSASQMKEPEI